MEKWQQKRVVHSQEQTIKFAKATILCKIIYLDRQQLNGISIKLNERKNNKNKIKNKKIYVCEQNMSMSMNIEHIYKHCSQ